MLPTNATNSLVSEFSRTCFRIFDTIMHAIHTRVSATMLSKRGRTISRWNFRRDYFFRYNTVEFCECIYKIYNSMAKAAFRARSMVPVANCFNIWQASLVTSNKIYRCKLLRVAQYWTELDNCAYTVVYLARKNRVPQNLFSVTK